ncbi:MAG: hypothetical protein DRR11_00990 [Gammaproteobacteria bacterium]|jgi:hypothetical protein|nr:MAG: hypothetical protein DRR15_15235 [Gammaproteobacteria bacterium]RLA35132.1 MAG: hypothetical protein DRR11_00990 [Gammaproteobacteria bacterium]
MQINTQTTAAAAPTNQQLDTADAVARAAHIWIRSLCLTELHAPAERHALACGLVFGLCERLELDPRVQELVAYVYALLDDEGSQALAASRMMLARSVPSIHLHAYKKGRSEAAAIVEMLSYHGDNY